MNLIFEDFLDYCDEDNEQLNKDIKTWLADFFDIHNRNIPLEKDEKKWIKDNLTKSTQIEIFGEVVIEN